MINSALLNVANIRPGLSMIIENVFSSFFLSELCGAENSKNENQNKYITNVRDVVIIKDTLKI